MFGKLVWDGKRVGSIELLESSQFLSPCFPCSPKLLLNFSSFKMFHLCSHLIRGWRSRSKGRLRRWFSTPNSGKGSKQERSCWNTPSRRRKLSWKVCGPKGFGIGTQTSTKMKRTGILTKIHYNEFPLWFSMVHVASCQHAAAIQLSIIPWSKIIKPKNPIDSYLPNSRL